jgi:hypothetical protein
MGSRNMALVSDGGKQRFVTIGDSLGGGTIESITASEIKVSGDAPRTIELASRAGDAVTRGHAAARPGQPVQPGQPGVNHQPGQQAGGLTVVKPTPTPVSPAGAVSGQMGLNGQEIPPMPDYITPEQAQRYEEIRSTLRQGKGMSSEQEILEFAAKVTTLEENDPKAAQQLLGKFVKDPTVLGNKKAPKP